MQYVKSCLNPEILDNERIQEILNPPEE